MTRKLLVGAVVAGALAVTAGTAFALTSNGQPSPTATPTTTTSTTSTTTPTTASPSSPTSSPTSSSSGVPAPGELSVDDAARLVRERMGGTVHEIEREVEHGRLEWKVEITARDGHTYDIRVDAATGDVTRIDQDDDRRGRGGDDDDDKDDDKDENKDGDHGEDRDDD